MDSTDFIRIFPVYILVYMNRINYMYKGQKHLDGKDINRGNSNFFIKQT